MDGQLKLVCLLTLLHALVYPYKCSSQPIPTVTASVYPNNNEVHREGDTVILICQATGFNSSLHVVSWGKLTPSSVIFANSRETYVSHDRYRVSFNETGIVILNLTIIPVETSDSGTYKCTLYEEELGSTSSSAVTHDLFVLTVYHRDAIPFCNAAGPNNVTIGSQLLCRTTGNATPVIEGDNVEWSYFTLDQEALLAKNVTSCDNNKTYMCVAEIEGSPTSLSCIIGPLTVIKVNDQSTSVTTTPVLETTRSVSSGPQSTETTRLKTTTAGTDSTPVVGLIIGIAVVSFVLLMGVVVIICCCRFDPVRYRWVLGACSSLITSHTNSKDKSNTDESHTQAASHPSTSGTTPFHENAVKSTSNTDTNHGKKDNQNKQQTTHSHANLPIETELIPVISEGTSSKNTSKSPSHVSHTEQTTDPKGFTVASVYEDVGYFAETKPNSERSSYNQGLRLDNQASVINETPVHCYMELNLDDHKQGLYTELEI